MFEQCGHNSPRDPGNILSKCMCCDWLNIMFSSAKAEHVNQRNPRQQLQQIREVETDKKLWTFNKDFALCVWDLLLPDLHFSFVLRW